MKLITCFLLLWSLTLSESYRMKEEKFLLKMEEKFLKNLTLEFQEKEFKSLLFRQLDDQKIYRPDNKSNPNTTSTKENKSFLSEEMRIYTGDYVSTTRHLIFLISKHKECSILVNDTLTYHRLANVNFIEHLILHNNGELIDPVGVYADKVNVSFFAFNRKLNLFSVYFENQNNTNDFKVEYDFVADGIIKTTFEKSSELAAGRMAPNVLMHSNNFSDEFGQRNDSGHNHISNYNWFLWKVLNENFLNTDQKVKIDVLFQMDTYFDHMNVEFSHNFTKSHEVINNEKLVKFSWEGDLKPSQVMVLECKFPMVFEKCGTLNLNFMMIMIGSVFIIFLIAMLHMILSNVFFEDY